MIVRQIKADGTEPLREIYDGLRTSRHLLGTSGCGYLIVDIAISRVDIDYLEAFHTIAP